MLVAMNLPLTSGGEYFTVASQDVLDISGSNWEGNHFRGPLDLPISGRVPHISARVVASLSSLSRGEARAMWNVPPGACMDVDLISAFLYTSNRTQTDPAERSF